ncbi:hypothetical protein ACVNS2_01110 [Paenibacillus caseinilyticus]|uniref:Uncharacterized protein n=1 Tax=Paenibacillus mucilaginosus K02 TaxID=997761 RepID=I0BAD3_9BACL|nr:hypothetical protein [Paenibacillus mucilaginosus]AFH59330.1 hypothetical protein B2K_01055 [Paenibacillus mucilaginosus K02]
MAKFNGETETKDPYVRVTFQALLEAVLPVTYRTPPGTGSDLIPVPGGVELKLHEYLIRELDHSQFQPVNAPDGLPPLSRSTAQMLDLGAEQYIRRGLALPLTEGFPGGGQFTRLAPIDRLLTLELIDRLEIPLGELSLPFKNNPGLVQTMVNSFTQLPYFGYYCEWYGYGTTRFAPPADRRLQFAPPGWQLAGYPGPSFGYREFRGFLLTYPACQGGSQ